MDSESLDPNFRPDHTDNLTFTIQRELNSHVQLEVGYIGKKISNEYQQLNLDSVPIYTTLGGQSFAQRLRADLSADDLQRRCARERHCSAVL